MKNANHVMESILKNVYSIVGVFEGNYKIIIVESNSTDGTKDSLSDAKTKDERLNVIHADFDLSSEEFKNRELRIAICRNLYLKAIYADETAYDYVIVIDLDEIFSESFNIDNLKKSLEFHKWDALFANQTDRYYDIWALRGLGVNYDCWNTLYADTSNDSYETKRKKYISSKQIQIPRNHPPIRVKSAFGGLGIYKHKMLIDLKPLYKEIGGACEHVEFHNQLIKAGFVDLFIHPNLLIKSPDTKDYKNYFG
jgi:glycosyltransferase involved in cell wall biosynthesis